MWFWYILFFLESWQQFSTKWPFWFEIDLLHFPDKERELRVVFFFERLTLNIIIGMKDALQSSSFISAVVIGQCTIVGTHNGWAFPEQLANWILELFSFDLDSRYTFFYLWPSKDVKALYGIYIATKKK